MIVSAIDGRIRIISPELKNSAKADALEKGLEQAEGITSARVNRLTGSLLVHYDSSLAGSKNIRGQIKQQINRISIRPGANSISGANARRCVKYGLLGSMFGNVAFLIFSSEKWHYRAGAAFLSLLSLHLFQNRRRLLK